MPEPLPCMGILADTGRVHRFEVGAALVGLQFHSLDLKLTIAEYCEARVQEWLKMNVFCRLMKGGELVLSLSWGK